MRQFFRFLALALALALVGAGCSNQNDNLFKAISKGDVSAVKTCLDRGADVNATIGSPEKQITPLIAAIVLKQEEIAKLLIIRGADIRQAALQYSTEDYARYLLGSDSEVLGSIVRKKVAQ